MLTKNQLDKFVKKQIVLNLKPNDQHSSRNPSPQLRTFFTAGRMGPSLGQSAEYLKDMLQGRVQAGAC